MALIIEDGTIVASANSYATVVELKAFATARGVALPIDATIESYTLVAIDYLEAQRSNYKGAKVAPATQSLQWPRQEVYIDDVLFPSTSIPKELRYAQCQLVIELSKGVNLQPTRSSAFVTHEKVGAIETRYSEKVATSVTPTMPAVDNWLEPLMAHGSLLSTVRV
jgi:hypothetical protein